MIRVRTFRTAQQAADFLNDSALSLSEVEGPYTNASGFVEVMYNDTSVGPQDVLGSEASPVVLGPTYTAGTTSDVISVSDSKYLAFFVYVTAVGGAATLYVQAEVAESATATEWLPLQAETVVSGTSTQDDYELQKAFTTTGLTLAVSLPTRGFKYWRLRVKCDAGAAEVYVSYSTAGSSL